MNAYKASVVKILVLVAMLVGVCLPMACKRAPSTNGEGEIKIAVPVPMTGKYTEFGQDLINAARIAVDEQNARGGVKGRKLALVTEDDKGDPRDAVTVAHKIAQDQGIIAIMGHLNSGTMLAASPVYAEAGIPVVMPVPTNPEITRQGFNNLFRIPITDDLQGAAAYDFLVSRADKSTLAIVHNRETYGRGIADEFSKTMEQDGGKAVLFEGVASGDQDYRPVIGRIRSLGASGIFFGGEYADAARFIRQAREQGVEVPIVMGDGCFNTEIAVIAGDAVRECFIANISPVNAPNEKAEAFYSEFRKRHGRIVAYAPLGYVATQIIIDAMEKSTAISRESVRSIINDPNYSFESIFGTYVFDELGDSKGRKIYWHKFENGELVAISSGK